MSTGQRSFAIVFLSTDTRLLHRRSDGSQNILAMGTKITPGPRVKSSNVRSKISVPAPQERRDSERIPVVRPCSYQFSRFSGDDSVELSEGVTLCINMSSGGMLLLLPQVLLEEQVFEVNAPSVRTEESKTKLVEVCWTRPLPLGVGAGIHLVGVRFLFELPSCQ